MDQLAGMAGEHAGIPGMDRLLPVLMSQAQRKLAAIGEAELQDAVSRFRETLRWVSEGDGGAG